MAKKSGSSREWLKEHHDDVWVREAKAHGYRSRASFKLLEIQDKDGVIRPGMRVVDLGAAPGGWSQVVAGILDGRGTVLASDILPMDSIAGVEFIQGDFTDNAVYEQLLAALDNGKADLVISDMAPNMSGMRDIDQPRVMMLAELALDMAESVLACNGSLLVKVFHGEGLQDYQALLKQRFNTVKTRKPRASRARSSEIYLLAQGFRGNP
ncbi:MAG: 23S rRNA (uridine(2552)-2'-O)-methyltransferase RlmE [Pseudohongiellaceae bacterium]